MGVYTCRVNYNSEFDIEHIGSFATDEDAADYFFKIFNINEIVDIYRGSKMNTDLTQYASDGWGGN